MFKPTIDFSDPLAMEVLGGFLPDIQEALCHEGEVTRAYEVAAKASKKVSPQPLPQWDELGTTMRNHWRDLYVQVRGASHKGKTTDPVYEAFREAVLLGPERSTKPAGKEDVDHVEAALTETANHMVDVNLTDPRVKTATSFTVHTPGSSSRKKGPRK